jgi:1,4-alpha-glucan branching enzyme
MKEHSSPYIDKKSKSIEFSVKNDCASQISLSGTFNHWAHDQLNLKPTKDGVWKIKIPMLPRGKYSYKFFVDDRMWMEDIDNPYREPDGVIGFNSILVVEN